MRRSLTLLLAFLLTLSPALADGLSNGLPLSGGKLTGPLATLDLTVNGTLSGPGTAAFLTTATAAGTYLTITGAASTYLTTATAASTYLSKVAPTYTGLMTGDQWTSSKNLAMGNSWFNVNQVTWSGNSGGNSGASTAAMSGVFNDTANNYAASAADILRLQDGIKSTQAGGRNVFEAVVTQTQANAPGDLGNSSQYTGITSTVSTNVIRGMTGQVAGSGIFGGQLYDSNWNGFYTQTTLKSGSGGVQGIIGAQINATMNAGTTAMRHVGVAVSEAGGAAAHGTYVDSAFLVGEQSNQGNPTVGWLTGLQFGSAVGQFSMDPTYGVLLTVVPKIYGGTSSATYDRGIDQRAGTITTGAWLSPNAGIDGSGNMAAGTISTPGGIAGKAATLTSVTIQDGGLYQGVPSVSVQAPLSGVTATITSPTVGGAAVMGFGSTGIGFTSSTSGGDTISMAGGTGGSPTFNLYVGTSTASTISTTVLTVGGTVTGKYVPGQVISGPGVTPGTRILWQITDTGGGPGGAGTYAVDQSQTVGSPVAINSDSVDGAGGTHVGRILALYLSGNGTLSAAPANPIQLTGGTGANAWLNVTTWTNTGTFYPFSNYVSGSITSTVGWQFAATGDGNYRVGDTQNWSNDTGATAVQSTVAAVMNTPYGIGTGWISGTTLTVVTAPTASFAIGQLLTGPGLNAGTVITGTGTGAGGTGTYTVSVSQTYASAGSPAAISGTGIVVNSGALGPIAYYASPTDNTLQPGLTISTVGSLTAVSPALYHTTSNVTGSGTGASFLTAYKIITAPVANAGSGYAALPPPLITTSSTNWRAANLLAVLTPALAPLPITCSTCTVNAAPMGRFVSVPGSSTAACAQGDFSADASYLYACRASNAWTRSANVGGW